MTPTAGRIVHYGIAYVDRGKRTIVPHAAIIVCVMPPKGLEAAVASESGGQRVVLRVLDAFPEDDRMILSAKYSETLAENCWSWPPRV